MAQSDVKETGKPAETAANGAGSASSTGSPGASTSPSPSFSLGANSSLSASSNPNGSSSPGANSGSSALFPSYARYPIHLVKGQGSWLWDDKGNRYLDFMSGLAVANLGHAPEKVKAKVKAQLDELWHVCNLFHIPQQETAARMLTEVSCADVVFFCNSGAEANEAAIKLARRYHQKVKGTERYEIITFEQSFHGRTLATLTATGQQKVKDGFLPLPAGFKTVPLYDMDALKAAIGPHTAAVMLEMVQAEGGVYPVDHGFVQELAALCREQGVLLIIDEVQTGMGRTGKWFAYQHYGIEPDIFTSAKGIASGLPAGAMLAKEYLREAFTPGTHASTFGGNPVIAAAIIATLETMKEERIPEHADEMGRYLISRLEKTFQAVPFVKEVRGKGLLIGIECAGPVADIVTLGQEKGLLFVTAGPNVIRLLPNLKVTKDDIDQAVAMLADVIAAYTAKEGK
ncbi:acetylornithine transaminase [Paenibacillus sp. FSL R5-0527]|uniref:Acetylornithine aminotransferase n=1 Tax=Paenibacillus macerans TaxID=44252 RepID=A0A090ZC68_PAEMA|nr:acetylornithine transaminase [Paenibacillus macerans]KFN07815.1 transaminase, acetylornithine/succinylornithine family protein [Paenibacillus macerans]MBS5910748.1 acetylornithine transaminase [Paenibacillus macerans]MCY7560739.1 acetylornithine transaminase [Paenibacillus macerans]MEC0155153.1 acetylornithine transaminase [Paenibacillus macerans]UMV48174.1 acetylornithine transaminase [Paenibacillus macerans]